MDIIKNFDRTRTATSTEEQVRLGGLTQRARFNLFPELVGQDLTIIVLDKPQHGQRRVPVGGHEYAVLNKPTSAREGFEPVDVTPELDLRLHLRKILDYHPLPVLRVRLLLLILLLNELGEAFPSHLYIYFFVIV